VAAKASRTTEQKDFTFGILVVGADFSYIEINSATASQKVASQLRFVKELLTKYEMRAWI